MFHVSPPSLVPGYSVHVWRSWPGLATSTSKRLTPHAPHANVIAKAPQHPASIISTVISYQYLHQTPTSSQPEFYLGIITGHSITRVQWQLQSDFSKIRLDLQRPKLLTLNTLKLDWDWDSSFFNVHSSPVGSFVCLLFEVGTVC